MEIQSARKIGRLATVSCVLGALSLGLIAAAFIAPLKYLSDGYGLEGSLAAGFLMVFFILGGFVVGFSGFVTGSIALRNEDGDHTTKRRAIVGLVLSGLAALIVLLLSVYIFLIKQFVS